MTDTREMFLGGRTFVVPPLPLGVNMEVVYPLCRQLSLPGALVDRVVTTSFIEAVTKEDLAILADICFACAQVAEPDLTAADFIEINPTPPQMFDAFYTVARYQTGVWSPVDPAKVNDQGEAEGEESPPEINLNRILARLIRYFHQPKEYWLKHGTLQDWLKIYSPELSENPPADDMVQIYFMAQRWWEPPVATDSQAAADSEPEVWECSLPGVTE